MLKCDFKLSFHQLKVGYNFSFLIFRVFLHVSVSVVLKFSSHVSNCVLVWSPSVSNVSKVLFNFDWDCRNILLNFLKAVNLLLNLLRVNMCGFKFKEYLIYL